MKSISWQRKQWPASVLLSARLISVLISRLITSSCRRKIRRLAIAQSVSVAKDRSCLLRSCAICRASAYGKLAVMFPMIISVEEVRKARKILREGTGGAEICRRILRPEDEVGIMIETPAAALISAELAKRVDFFSIGTNDLSQYTLAIGRQNQQLEPFFDAHHPAILRLIEMTVQGAHAAGIWCGICGELGADLSLTKGICTHGHG